MKVINDNGKDDKTNERYDTSLPDQLRMSTEERLTSCHSLNTQHWATTPSTKSNTTDKQISK